MAALVYLLILCCSIFYPIHCQVSKNLEFPELTANRYVCSEASNKWVPINAITKREAPNLSVTDKTRNQRDLTGVLRKNNIDDPYNACSVRTLSCDPNFKYRSLDGSCNNLENPTWGMANTTFLRILPANYKNGTAYVPPISTNGQPLPSARLLSSVFFPDANKRDLKISLAGMQWGQFVSHDVALSTDLRNSEQINCCNKTIEGNEETCFPINIPLNDPFYAKFNITCQNMVRAAFILSSDCSSVAEQFNHISHFLDGSQIYGSDLNVSRNIREFKSGRLLTQTCENGKTFLPSVDSTISCNNTNDGIRFLAGDTRVNQNPQLTILHTLLVREHNRIVDKLERLHPDWNDEMLFQESRSIVIAELQHITYNEWLPLLLGKNYMKTYRLYSNIRRNFTYNNKLKPVTTNSFTTSAFRVGHSAIQGQTNLFSSYSECPVRSFNFSNLLDHPNLLLQQEFFDEFTRGLTKQSMQKIDNFHTIQITQQLFHGNRSYGSDLMSTDIQRGRDHGIAPYIEYLHFCTGYKPQNFTDLRKFIPQKFVSLLEKHYATVRDIDLFIGGNLEKPKQGATTGPTFGCIIAEQFYRYKYGDRFWYEIRGHQHSFTNQQIYEIKKSTLSRIICDNSNNIVNIGPNSFLQLSKSNHVVPCDTLPSVNISRWK